MIYGAAGVDYDRDAESSIKLIESHGQGQVPVCMAKTQKSLSDSARLRGRQGLPHPRERSAAVGGRGVRGGDLRRDDDDAGASEGAPAAVRIEVDDEGRATGLS